MIRTKCPCCGCNYEMRDQTYEEQVFEIVEAIWDEGEKATTKKVAAHLPISEAQTRRYLKRLESWGRVRRVGQRAGWRIAA